MTYFYVSCVVSTDRFFWIVYVLSIKGCQSTLIETNILICSGNQLAGFSVAGILIFNKLMQ